ncbi:hypothetical protein FQN54_008042 [Arachnomyces sp. PD_36]|nr:hypothetical protein FQN54_008042 [Arachnomyces sp. PD_36]
MGSTEPKYTDNLEGEGNRSFIDGVVATDEVHSKEDDQPRKQDGVEQLEAITQVWSKKALYITFVLLYIVSFVDSLTQSTQTQLTAYVTSDFSEHALLSTTNVVSSIVGGVAALPISKIINIWGRVEGLILMLLLMVVGLIIKAVCPNVEAYAAAHTLFWVGHIGLVYIVSVFIADITSLKGRMLMFGINATPSIATTFAGPAIAQEFLDHSTWRWAFGAFCIILPALSVPVVVSFIVNHQKAKRLGMATKRDSGRTLLESAKYYVREFDVLGMLLTTAGFALILLPLSLASSSGSKWKSGHIIAMIVLGVCCLIAFLIWERCCWDIYFSSYLQVVNQQSVQNAGYILNSYSLTSSVLSPMIGLLIQRTGTFKWIGIASIPFAALGTGLLIYFRHPGSVVGYLVMCQIFNGVAGGAIALTTQMAVMAEVSHNEVAVVLAMHGVFGSIGSSMGLSISGAIWTNTLPDALYKHLSESHKDQYMTIYGSLKKQLEYDWGTPVRDAIVAAYGDTQRALAIAGASFVPLMHARPSCLNRSFRYISSVPPVISIKDGTFYRQYPSFDAPPQSHNPPLYPKLNFELPATATAAETAAEKPNLQHWGIVGSSGRTTFLKILQGQHIAIPPRARSYPYLASEEFTGKHRSPSRAIRYVGFADDGPNAQSPRGSYLSARYESRREETDFTLLDYLKGRTSLNPMEGEEDGTLHDDALLNRVIASLHLEKLVDLPVGNLSNGQTRRARIAKELLGSPEVLLIDEPFMGLDPKTRTHLSEILGDLAMTSSPRLILSLRPQDAFPEWLTHLAILGNDHHVSLQGEKEEVTRQLEIWKLLLQPAPETTDTKERKPLDPVLGIPEQKFEPHSKDAGINSRRRLRTRTLPELEAYEALSPEQKAVYDKAHVQFEKGIIDLSLAQDLGVMQGVGPASPKTVELGDPVVQMEGVQVKYGDDIVLGDWKQDINGQEKAGLFWEVRRGERWGVLGPNGSGKTTLLSLITSDHPQAYSLPLKILGRSRLPQPGKPGISIFDLQSRIGHSSPEIHSFFPRHLSIRQSVESAFADTFLSKPRLDHQRDLDVDAALGFFEAELNPNFVPWFEQENHPQVKPEELDSPSEDDIVLISALRRSYSTKRSNLPQDPTALDWADNITFAELSVPQQRVVLLIRALVHKPDLVVLDEAFSGMSRSTRDRCLHFLQAGEQINPPGTRKRTTRDLPRAVDVHKKDLRHFGLSKDQALIIISHVKEEVPPIVRNWMYLPGPDDDKTGNAFRTGILDKGDFLSERKVWNHIWDPVRNKPKSRKRKN